MCQTEGLVCVEPARSWEGRVEVMSHAEPRVKSWCLGESAPVGVGGWVVPLAAP